MRRFARSLSQNAADPRARPALPGDLGGFYFRGFLFVLLAVVILATIVLYLS